MKLYKIVNKEHKHFGKLFIINNEENNLPYSILVATPTDPMILGYSVSSSDISETTIEENMWCAPHMPKPFKTI